MSFERTAMGLVFKKKANPTLFLSSMFQTPDRNIFPTIQVQFDIKRSGEEMSVDIVRGTGGRLNYDKQFTNKNYIPPMYDEYGNVNEAEQLLYRVAGKNEYDDVLMADIIDMITNDQVLYQDKILRAIEYQAAQVLFNGTIVLIFGDTIDFKMKATHKVNQAWSGAGDDPDAGLQTVCDLNRADGLGTSTDAIFGATALNTYLNNAKVIAKSNFRRVDRIDIRPPLLNSDGANFHGTISVGDYTLNVWTYPQVYTVPMGYGLPNEGTKVPYVPTSKVWVGNPNARFDLIYGGVAQLLPADPRLAALGISNMPLITAGKWHLYGATDFKAQNVIYGVRSAPLCIPTDIDSYSVITTS